MPRLGQEERPLSPLAPDRERSWERCPPHEQLHSLSAPMGRSQPLDCVRLYRVDACDSRNLRVQASSARGSGRIA